MLVLSAAAMTCGVLSAKYATFASQGFAANLRQALFDKVQEFSFADIDRFSSASLITRMTNDVNALTMMLNMGLRMLFRAPAQLIFALVISFTINARLACVLLVIIPVMALAIAYYIRHQQDMVTEEEKKTAEWTEDQWEDYYSATEAGRQYLIAKWGTPK
jgi:ATP-binding cassette subfamily B protein